MCFVSALGPGRGRQIGASRDSQRSESPSRRRLWERSEAETGTITTQGMSGVPNFGPSYRHVALPPIDASPDKRPWDTTPGSHRWLGARVAWEFGKEIYAGTCTGWKKKDNVLGYAIWFVCYDDGDTEVFDVAHMRYSMRLHGQTERFRDSGRAPRTPQKSCAEAEVAAPSPRRSQGVLSTASRASRLSVEQDLLPFPVLISPQRLQQGPLSDRAAATPGATVQSRKRKWLEPTHERTPAASEAAVSEAVAAVAEAAAPAAAEAVEAAEAAEVAAIEVVVAEASSSTSSVAAAEATEAAEAAEAAANLQAPLCCSRNCSLEL